MKSPYYKVTPKGYILTHQNAPAGTDPSKQLPVYRVVSEFMNLTETEQEEPNYCQDSHNNKVFVDVTKSETSEQDHITSEIRYLSRKQSMFIEKDEIKSIYTSEQKHLEGMLEKEGGKGMTNSLISQGLLEVRRKKNATQMQAKTDVITDIESTNNSKVLVFELEKEKILRKNLQKSYKNLLKQLQQRQYVVDFHDNEHKTLIKREKNRRFNLYSDRKYEYEVNNEQQVINQQDQRQKQLMKRRKSCGNLLQIANKEGEDDSKEGSHQTEFLDFCQEDRLFKGNLQNEIKNLNMRLDRMSSQILKKQLLMSKNQERAKMVRIENEQLKKKMEHQNVKQSTQAKPQKQETGLAKKEHMHYIFTIFMMFLCLAIVVKRQ